MTQETQGAFSTRPVTVGQIHLSGSAKVMEGILGGEIRKGEQNDIQVLRQLLESNKMRPEMRARKSAPILGPARLRARARPSGPFDELKARL